MRYEMLLPILSLILVGGITSVFAEFESDSNELYVYGGQGKYTVEELEAEQIASTDLGNIDVLLAHSHSGFDTVSNYFTDKGKYLVRVSVLGVDFQDIPVETAIFTLIVGDVDEEKTKETSQSSQNTDTAKESKTIPDWIINNAE